MARRKVHALRLPQIDRWVFIEFATREDGKPEIKFEYCNRTHWIEVELDKLQSPFAISAWCFFFSSSFAVSVHVTSNSQQTYIYICIYMQRFGWNIVDKEGK